ncbi:MAG: PAS domain-containing protein [Peptostreptococcaceae bacterium]
MYKYLDIFNLSILLVSLYIVSSNLIERKNKNIVFQFIILVSIIFLKIICISGYFKDIKLISNNATVNLITLILLVYLEIDEKNKKEKIILWISYLLSIGGLALNYILNNQLLITVIETYVLISTIYLLVLKISKKTLKTRYLISFIYVGQIFINLILDNNLFILNMNSIICLISSVYVSMKYFNNFVRIYYDKNIKILSKLNRSKINIRIHNEKLNLRKNLNSELNYIIKNKENLLYETLMNSKKCVYMIDDEDYIINEDRSFYEMWKEYSQSKYNISIDDFCEDSLNNSSEFIECINKVRTYKKEEEIQIKDNQNRTIKCKFIPRDLNNSIICIMKDISFRKQIEMKVEDNTSKYRKIVDNIPYSVLMVDDKNILYNNNKNQYIDFSKDDIKNILLGDCLQGEFYYTYQNGMAACLDIDKINYLEDGSNRSLLLIKDITDFKILLRNLERSKKRYESLVNMIPEGIYVVNFENKTLQYANKAFLNMVGSNNLEEIDIDSINENIIITSGNINDNVKYKRDILKNKFGEKIDIECGGMLLNINKNINMIGIIRDITDQIKSELIEKEIEEKEKLNKSKNQFFINMSHELKTPVNLIHASNQLVEVVYKYELEKNKNVQLLDTFNVVKKHVNILMGLIDNIIELAKLQSDFHEMHRDNYNIVDISEDTVTEFNKCVEDNINIIFDTDEEEKIVNADPNDIEKVILILLSRVIRYSAKNSNVNFDIGSRKDFITISIKNEGGYDNDKYVHDVERKVLDMGITIAKLIIELYEGKLSIKTSSNDSIEVTVEIKADYEIKIYKNRIKNRQGDFIVSEYKKMCDF